MNEPYKIIYGFEKKFILHPSGAVQVLDISDLQKQKELAEQEIIESQKKLNDVNTDISNTQNPTMFNKILTALHIIK